MTDSSWSEERVAQLTSLWREGLSASQVATTLGNVTRNAVLGKLHRLGLLGGSTEARPVRPRSATMRCRTPRSPKVAPSVSVAEPDAFTFADGTFATVVSINDRMCRWPIGDPKAGDFHFCGHSPKAGSRYCEAHTQRAHQPAKIKHNREDRCVATGAAC